LFNFKKIIVPVHDGGNHWTLIEINFQGKSIEYYDSLGGDGRKYVIAIFQYIEDEYQKLFNRELPQSNTWSLITGRRETPQQSNGYDCGVFVCLFAETITRNVPPNFSQSDINDSTRIWSMNAILQKRIPSINWRYCNPFS